MPYKNREDKLECQKRHRDKKRDENRVIRYCKLDNCNKELPTHKSSFCSDGHATAHFQDVQKNLRMKEKQQQAKRYCKLKECGKLIPAETTLLKQYCPNSNCQQIQNKRDAKTRYDLRQKNKKKVFRNCGLLSCGKKFDTGRRAKYYHTPECKKEADTLRRKLRNKEDRELREENKLNRKNIDKLKGEVLGTNKEPLPIKRRAKRNDVINIHPKFLVRNYDNLQGSNQKATMLGEA